jgi:stress-induced morphogen
MVEELSNILTKDFNPQFLAFDFFDENINVVISSNCFINQSIPERVRSVYSCIEKKLPELFEKHSVFVHTFTQEEMLEVLKKYNEEGI